MGTVTQAPMVAPSRVAVASRAHAYSVCFVDEASGLSAGALVLPTRSGNGGWSTERGEQRRAAERGLRADLDDLGMSLVVPVRASDLPVAVLWAVADEHGSDRLRGLLGGPLTSGGPQRGVAQPLPLPMSIEQGPRAEASITFAEFLAFAPLMPVEHSPLRGEALAALLTGAGTTGAGALVAAGADPLLAVKAAVGAGAFIVLVGTATAITEGLTHHIRRWFRVPEEPPAKSGDS